jgi:hypothetical protein
LMQISNAPHITNWRYGILTCTVLSTLESKHFLCSIFGLPGSAVDQVRSQFMLCGWVKQNDLWLQTMHSYTPTSLLLVEGMSGFCSHLSLWPVILTTFCYFSPFHMPVHIVLKLIKLSPGIYLLLVLLLDHLSILFSLTSIVKYWEILSMYEDKTFWCYYHCQEWLHSLHWNFHGHVRPLA